MPAMQGVRSAAEEQARQGCQTCCHEGMEQEDSVSTITREQVIEWLRLAERASLGDNYSPPVPFDTCGNVKWLCRALLETQDRLALALDEVRAGREKIDHDNDVAGEAGDPIPAMLKARKLNAGYTAARAALGEEV